MELITLPDDVRLFIVFMKRTLHTSGAFREVKLSCDWNGPAIVVELKNGLKGLTLLVVI